MKKTTNRQEGYLPLVTFKYSQIVGSLADGGVAGLGDHVLLVFAVLGLLLHTPGLDIVACGQDIGVVFGNIVERINASETLISDQTKGYPVRIVVVAVDLRRVELEDGPIVVR